MYPPGTEAELAYLESFSEAALFQGSPKDHEAMIPDWGRPAHGELESTGSTCITGGLARLAEHSLRRFFLIPCGAFSLTVLCKTSATLLTC